MRASAANTIRAWGCFGRAERKQLRPRILFGRAERQQLRPRNHVVHAGGRVDSKARETVREMSILVQQPNEQTCKAILQSVVLFYSVYDFDLQLF